MPKSKEKESSRKEDVDLKSLKKEIDQYIDEELDKKVEVCVSKKVKSEFIEEIDKVNKRVIREKNRKIMFKNMFLILFLGIILLLLFLLYQEGYFDKYFNHNKTNNKEAVEKTHNNDNQESEVKIEPTLSELKEKYGKYIDPIYLNQNSIYLEEFYQGKVTNELKMYWTFNNIDFESLEVEDDYQVVDGDAFCEEYNRLFIDQCSPRTFNYDGHKIRYVQKIKSFITDEILEKDSNNISREIININVNGDIVSIETIEGIINSDGLYAIYPYKYIGEYNGSLTSYQELNHVIYKFKDGKLLSIGEEL